MSQDICHLKSKQGPCPSFNTSEIAIQWISNTRIYGTIQTLLLTLPKKFCI